MTRVGLVVLATLVYAGTLGSPSPMDLGLGAAVAALVAAGRWRPSRLAPLRERSRAWPRAVADTLREIGQGSADMLRVLLGRGRVAAGVVEVPTESMSGRAAVIAEWIVSVSPGSVVLKVDETRRTMTVHMVDTREAAALGRELPRLVPRAFAPQGQT